MKEKLVFIYDGECPFCNKFAELIELQSGLSNISILNGRDNISIIRDLLKKGFDLNDGAILLKGDEVMHGAKAINFICSKISNPSDALLKIISDTFRSNKRTDLIFPLLLIARRISLKLKGVPIKLIS